MVHPDLLCAFNCDIARWRGRGNSSLTAGATGVSAAPCVEGAERRTMNSHAKPSGSPESTRQGIAARRARARPRRREGHDHVYRTHLRDRSGRAAIRGASARQAAAHAAIASRCRAADDRWADTSSRPSSPSQSQKRVNDAFFASTLSALAGDPREPHQARQREASCLSSRRRFLRKTAIRKPMKPRREAYRRAESR